MVDIDIFHKSLKLTWFRMFWGDMCNDVEHLMKAFLKQPLLLYLGDDYFFTLANKIDNPFWKEMLKYLGMVIQSNTHSFPAQPLWKNSKIQIDQKSIFFKKWNQIGIRFINDLVDQDGRILSRNEFEKKFSTSLDFLQYFSVCQVIICTI